MTIRDELVRLIAERMAAYCEEYNYDKAEFDWDIDEFELLSVGDVIGAFMRAEGEGFGAAEFVRDIREKLKEV